MPTPTTVVLFGATGDLAQRKLLPGLLHLFQSGLLTEVQVVGHVPGRPRPRLLRRAGPEGDRRVRRGGARPGGLGGVLPAPALGPRGRRPAPCARPSSRRRRCSRPARSSGACTTSASRPAEGRPDRGARARGRGPGRAQPDHHGEAVRVDLESARKLNAELHEVFDEEQIFRIDHFLGKEAAQNILAFRFANGLFEPIWHRNHISHVQIDVPEELGLAQRANFYESTGAYRDMVSPTCSR